MPEQYYHLISRDGDGIHDIIECLSLKDLVCYARGFARQGRRTCVYRGSCEAPYPKLVAYITPKYFLHFKN